MLSTTADFVKIAYIVLHFYFKFMIITICAALFKKIRRFIACVLKIDFEFFYKFNGLFFFSWAYAVPTSLSYEY